MTTDEHDKIRARLKAAQTAMGLLSQAEAFLTLVQGSMVMTQSEEVADRLSTGPTGWPRLSSLGVETDAKRQSISGYLSRDAQRLVIELARVIVRERRAAYEAI